MVKKSHRSATKALLVTLLTQNLAFAAEVPRLANPKEGEATPATASEYRAGQYPGAVLMPVQLWGAVQKPGSFELPVKTDLTTFLSFAGGPTKDAEMDSVTIRRTSRGKTEILKVDLDELFSNSRTSPPVLEPNDVVHIPAHKPFIDPDVAQTFAIVGVTLSIILSAVVVSAQLKK